MWVKIRDRVYTDYYSLKPIELLIVISGWNRVSLNYPHYHMDSAAISYVYIVVQSGQRHRIFLMKKMLYKCFYLGTSISISEEKSFENIQEHSCCLMNILNVIIRVPVEFSSFAAIGIHQNILMNDETRKFVRICNCCTNITAG